MEEKKLQDLLAEMTLDEKIAQLLQVVGDFYSNKSEGVTGPQEELGLTEKDIENAGSALSVSGAEETIAIQQDYLTKNRLGIPLLFMADIIHGFRTIFPIPLALGATWNLETAEKVAEISAKEAAVSGIHVTFSPMVDLVRDPRWGRVLESTGEDPFLNGLFAKAFVHGYQGENLKDDTERVASCVKHFAAYGAAQGGRDYHTVDMSELELRENYLPAYQAALEAGAKLVMSSFNTVRGIPATGNKWLLKDILRDEMSFDGVLISDWRSVVELVPHGVAADEKEAARLSLNAGVDIEMMSSCYTHGLKALLADEQISINQIDEAVLRILVLKNDLGLFENPYRGASVEKEKGYILSAEHRQVAKEAAQQSLVLLKNEKALPLNREQNVALVGPAASSQDILGEWSWQGKKEEAISLAAGLSEQLGSKLKVFPGFTDYFNESAETIAEAVSFCEESDAIVLALGEPSWMSGEAASRTSIELPAIQLELFKALRQLNKKLIVTLYNGRPLDLTAIQEADAIVEAWYPGTEGGNALAEILIGNVAPSGRLSMSFPENVGQVPVFYNTHNTGRPADATPDEKYVSKYLDASNYPRYPFGFGLSYTEFTYGELILSSTEMSVDKSLEVTLNVKNSGNRIGTETVQLYIRDLVGEVVRPLKELKAFKQVTLEPNEEIKITFEITEKMLQYIHADMNKVSDSGQFMVMVGPNSQTLQIKEFNLTK